MSKSPLLSRLAGWLKSIREPRPRLEDDGLPLWEKNPVEQRNLRQERVRETSAWFRLPRGY